MRPSRHRGPTRRWSRQGSLAALVVLTLAAQLVAAPVVAALTPTAITFSLPASGFVGSTLPLEASADSGLAVAYAADPPETCAIDATTLTLVAVGSCSVTASQAGDETHDPAEDVVATIDVEAIPPDLTAQEITFTLPASGVAGDVVSMAATATSGLAVSYVSTTPDVCTTADAALTLIAAGSCSVTASQAGDDTYAPAPDATATVAVKAPQTITFSLPTSGFVNTKVGLAGLASSGLTVSYAISTPTICEATGVKLALKAVGTCTVTAAQAGDANHVAAADVEASMTVQAVPSGVDLGKYAVNGTVRAVVSDAATGRTYLGGDFTEIGLRTGPVAVVTPPDIGSGSLKATSPEVLGTVRVVYADDRPDDPGFFIVGELLAVNGAPVPAVPVIRMHLDGSESKWVVDPAWHVTNPDECHGFGFEASVATPDLLVAGGYTSSANVTGLQTIDRTTGTCSPSLASVSSPLPPLAGCAGLSYCFAKVDHLMWIQDSGRLIVSYGTWVGAASNAVHTQAHLASYDLAPDGGLLWSTMLQAESPPDVSDWFGLVTQVGQADGEILVQGTFPFDVIDQNDPSHLLAIDPATGAIVQRWNTSGEQHLIGGGYAGPASLCLTAYHGSALFDVDGRAARWVSDQAGIAYTLCAFRAVSGSIEADPVGDYTVPTDDPAHLPTAFYRAPGGTEYLLGASRGIVIATGASVDWHPDPGTAFGARPTAFAFSTAGVVIAGDFTFVRGRAAAGVVALTTSLSPDPAFTSPVSLSPSHPDVRSLALDQGWLLVGGFYYMPTEPGADWDWRTIIALDATSGDLEAWTPSTDHMAQVDTIAVHPDTGEFWVGGVSIGYTPSTPILHFASPMAGAGPLTVPSLTCLDAGGSYTRDPVCGPESGGGIGTEVQTLLFDPDRRLYIAGSFGEVDGHARRGLARLGTDGEVDGWDPDLLGVIPITGGSYLGEMTTRSLAVLHDRLLVGGSYCSFTPSDGGGGHSDCGSPLLVFSTETDALVRPTDPALSSWFPVFGWWTSGHAILASDTGVVVALGDAGVMVLDPVTLDLDVDASAPFANIDWWAHDIRNGVFALAEQTVAPVEAASSISLASWTAPSTKKDNAVDAAAAPSTRIVMAGSIPRWGDHVAGNMVTADVAASVDFVLTTTRAGDGAGTVTSSPSGIACGTTCAHSFESGTTIHLTASPSSGSSFSGWSGGGCSGTGTCTVTLNGATTVTATFLSGIVPTVTAPSTILRAASALSGSSIPVHLTWTGADTGGPGIDHFVFERSTNGGSTWTTVSSSLTARAADTFVGSSGTARFRVRAVDTVGRWSAWAAGPTLTPRLVQQSSTSVTYHGTWKKTTSSLDSGGTARYAKAKGAYASYKFTGRSIGLVVTTGSTRGKVKIYVNGTYAATVDLRSNTTRHRVVLWQKTWSTSATRTIRLVVAGTSKRPRVDLDGFVTLR